MENKDEVMTEHYKDFNGIVFFEICKRRTEGFDVTYSFGASAKSHEMKPILILFIR